MDGQRRMDGDDIGGGKQSVKVYLMIALLRRLVGSRVVYDVCTEGGGNLCNLSPNISKSDDPEAHGGKFVKMFGKMSENPVAHVAFFFYIVVIVAHLLQQIKEHGKGVLCHRICGVSCHIAPCDATAFEIVFVQIVCPSSSHTYQL